MNKTLISVIVPTYDRPDMLRNALRSLSLQETDQGVPYEIVVIDNASKESTRAVVAEIAGSSPVPVRYFREEAAGYPMALNRGVKEALGGWLAFFDDDQLAEPNWLKELLTPALATGGQVVGGSIWVRLPVEETPPLGPVCRSLLGEHAYDGTARVCEGRSIPSGGNMLVAREVFDAVGLFDISMAVGGCDSDFLLRARAHGITVLISPTAVVHHVVPPYRMTSSYLRWASMRWGCQYAYLDCKNFGRARLLGAFVARVGQTMFINVPLWLFGILTRNGSHSLDRENLLWRALGYACGTACITAPGVVKHSNLLSRLEFRKERTAFPASQA